MLDILRRLLRRIRYGREIIVVSGLPRSGTSMMMRMLDAAGLPVLTDHRRGADANNPLGYLEYERVKRLAEEDDKSWVRQARGKVLKVISHLLGELPGDNTYRVILMRRDLEEVLASQNKMLERLEQENPVSDEKAREHYRNHLLRVRAMLRARPNFEFIELDYRRALEDPRGFAEAVDRFLGGSLDVEAMASVVDPKLYRQRKDEISGGGRGRSHG